LLADRSTALECRKLSDSAPPPLRGTTFFGRFRAGFGNPSNSEGRLPRRAGDAREHYLTCDTGGSARRGFAAALSRTKTVSKTRAVVRSGQFARRTIGTSDQRGSQLAKCRERRRRGGAASAFALCSPLEEMQVPLRLPNHHGGLAA